MSDEARFGHFQLSGGRFDEAAGMPIAALVELRRYESIIETIAEALYKREHVSRQRVPRGFRRTFDLRVSAFQEGSVIPVLERVTSQTSLDVAYDDYFEQARDIFLDELKYFEESSQFSSRMPGTALQKISTFGSSLSKIEVVTIADVSRERNVRLDYDYRQRLSQGFTGQTYEDETVLLGQLTGLDSSGHKIVFYLAEDGLAVTGSFSNEALWPDFLEVLGYQQRAPMIAMSVQAEYSSTGDLQRILEVYAIERALPEILAARVAELAALDTGWFHGDGEKLSSIALDGLEELLLSLVDAGSSNVAIFPRPNGGVQIEWVEEDYEVEIDPDGTFIAYALSEDREDDSEHQFPANTRAEKIIDWLAGAPND